MTTPHTPRRTSYSASPCTSPVDVLNGGEHGQFSCTSSYPRTCDHGDLFCAVAPFAGGHTAERNDLSSLTRNDHCQRLLLRHPLRFAVVPRTHDLSREENERLIR